MGPCFMSTEDDLALPRRHQIDECFNGAVLHEHGRLITSNAMRRPLKSFNGAVLHEHGRPHGCMSGIYMGAASMGPCFMSTEDAGQNRSPLPAQTASMGPCFMSTEDIGLPQF